MKSEKDFRHHFIYKVEEKTNLSIGLYAIHFQGMDSTTEYLKIHPNAKSYFARGKPNHPKTRQIRYVPQLKDCIKYLDKRKGLILEPFWCDLVQTLFDFLDDLLCYHILSNQPKHEATKAKVVSYIDKRIKRQKKTSIESTTFEELKDTISWLTNKDKFNAVKLAYNIDWGKINKEYTLINKSIQKRNIIQHSDGKIMAKHLKKQGFITTDDGKKIRKLNEGDRVIISAWDIEAFSEALIRLAYFLIPE